MTQTKSLIERIFHAFTFEVLAVLISAPALSWLMGVSVAHAGLLTLMISVIAMVWNMLFNMLFERLEQHWRLVRTVKVRMLHAVAFECGLVVTVIPLAAWWLQVSLFDAFLLDIGLVLFFLPYTFVFNLVYDRLREKLLKRGVIVRY